MASIEELREKYTKDIQIKAHPFRTICEVQREMWDIIEVMPQEDLRKELQTRLVTAYTMAKKMNEKLHEYKHGWDEGFWEANENYEKDLLRRQKRKEKL